MVARRLGGFRHGFHEEFLAGPLIPGLRDVVDRMNLLLADLPVGAADGDVLHGTAEAAHGVALEVGQDDHGVVVADVLAHRDGLEVLAALHGEHRRAFGVHDVDRAEGPAVHLEGFKVLFRRVAVSHVERVRFDDRAVGNVLLEGFDHVARQNVRAVAFTRVELDRDLPDDFFVDERVELLQVFGVDLAREVDLRLFAAEVGADAAAAHDRGLREFAVDRLGGAFVFVAAAGHVCFSFLSAVSPPRRGDVLNVSVCTRKVGQTIRILAEACPIPSFS